MPKKFPVIRRLYFFFLFQILTHFIAAAISRSCSLTSQTHNNSLALIQSCSFVQMTFEPLSRLMCIVENEPGHLTPFAMLTMESFRTAQAVSDRHELSCFQGIGCIESHKGYSLWELWIQQISAKGQKKNSDTNKAWSHAQYRQSSTSFWKTCPCTWRDKDLKPTRRTRDNREVKGPIGSGHGHMTRPQAIPKRLPALVFSSARRPACRGLLMRSCREKKSRHCSGAEESIGYLSKGALSGI